MNGYIIAENANNVFYAYYHRRFWRWDAARSVWKESHLMAQKYERAKAALATLTPEAFLTNSTEFTQPDEYELDTTMLDALKAAKPCKTVPIEPVKEESKCPVSIPEASPQSSESAPAGHVDSTSATPSALPIQTNAAGAVQGALPTAPSFDFGADDQTNALLLQDAQTFITGNMARIMAAKHAHDLCANHYKGTWGKWCATVGISRDTGENMVRVAEQFGNIQLEGKSILDVQPMKLLYAAAKPSTPEELVEKVKNGDITTNKQYQELLAQLKAEKERSAAAEAREEEVWKMHEEARKRAETAESRYEAALADVNNLAEANQQKNKELEAARKDLRAARDCYSVAKKNEVCQCERIKTLQEENTSLKKQPITAVVDKEEVERQAREMAAEMTADLRAQLEQASSGSEQDARNAYDSILRTGRSIENIWQTVKPLFRKMPAEQREDAANHLVHALATIQGEVSKCL